MLRSFGLAHVARRDPIIAAPVLAEFDQVWRTANRAHRPVILFLAGGVAMHEHRHVAPRECGLMVCDRVERDTRFRDDAFAVALRDSSVILDPLGQLRRASRRERVCTYALNWVVAVSLKQNSTLLRTH